MRRINAKPLNTQEWKDWIAECEVETTNNINKFSRSEEIEITSLYKKKYIKDNYYFSNSGPFHGKCVYCETPIHDLFPGDVEHYRPKGKVTDLSYSVVYCQDDDGTYPVDIENKKIEHPGYYWLAYSWQNLMPSCTFCNRPKKDFGKRNCFPVKGINKYKVGDERMEEPLILNPTDLGSNNNPEKHFEINYDDGFLIGLTDEAKTCNRVFGLNKRDKLIKGRLTAIGDAQSLISQLIYSDTNHTTFARIESYQKGIESYSLAFMLYFNKFMKKIGAIS